MIHKYRLSPALIISHSEWHEKPGNNLNRGQKVVRSAKKNANEEYGLGRRVCAEKNPLQLTIVRKEKDSMPNRSKRADKS